MARKGKLSLFNLRHHQNQNRPSKEPPSPTQCTFSYKITEENISNAETIITKWDTNSSNSNMTSLLNDPDEAKRFNQAVTDLQRALIFLTSLECLESPKSQSHSLVRAQSLMEIAMLRLQKEFYQILSSNQKQLDPEIISSVHSVRLSESDPESEEEIRTVKDSTSKVADLRSIALAMISAGYSKECIKIYKIMRKSIVDEGLYRLGLLFPTLNQIQKLDWQLLDIKIRTWLSGSRVAIRTLFTGERILCDHVFEGSDPIRESCFTDITRDAAVNLLGFVEMITKTKRSPEKLFRILDMYNSISDLWMDIESVFSFGSTSVVRSQALSSLLKLAEAARLMISDFELAIQTDGSKTAVPGGGIHPITRYSMNYIIFLADYENVLAEIYADFPLQMPPAPDSSAILSAPPSPSSSEENPKSAISVRLAWLILVLSRKLEGKAEIYKDTALSYLFLANNLHYTVKKVEASRLGFLLGKDWIAKHSAKAMQYVESYEELGWARVAAEIPPPELAEESPSVAEDKIRVFNTNFEEAVTVQREWVIADPTLKEEVRNSVAELVVPAYRAFYDSYRPVVSSDDVAGGRTGTALRFAPEDVMGRVMELFSGTGSGSGSGFGHGSSKPSWWSGSH